MNAAITVETLSKQYRLGQRLRQKYSDLRDVITSAASAPIRMIRSLLEKHQARNVGNDGNRQEHIWAVDNVSFKVQPGEVIGIIGRNGAGKSTLLKMLSRVVEPTSGRIVIRGRVGSLLEVGTGFHPDLTGRENIYLNGSILGMTRREIDRKLDEIIDFSGVEKFIDTPIKRYSSGMQVRLAFSVAAHLEPEILIIDEVLAVGDAEFQKKCLGKMRDAASGGRTVLFVSHNMGAIEALCNRVIVMAGGRTDYDGPVNTAMKHYHDNILLPNATNENVYTPGNGVSTVFRSAVLLDENGNETNTIAVGSQFRLRIGVSVPEPITNPTIGLGLDNLFGQRILSVHSPSTDSKITELIGDMEINCDIPMLPLFPGEYMLKLSLDINGHEADWVNNVLQFSVRNGNMFGQGRSAHRGYCVAPSDWSVSPLANAQRQTA